MSVHEPAYLNIVKELNSKKVTLVAVSKKKSEEEIRALYELGQKHFGENYVQELLTKHARLPQDIHWHFIGHLQSNKVKYIVPFIHLIHSVDSFKLLQEINKQSEKLQKTTQVLLQVHIATEETKFGMDERELEQALADGASLRYVKIMGLMGMASFTNDQEQVRKEFEYLSRLYQKHQPLDILSMGMSGDYRLAIEAGSNMVRIGSLIFGERS